MNRQYPIVNPAHYPSPHQNSLVELGKLGALVGLCGAGATNLHRLRRARVDATEALVDTLKTGVATGVATATAGLVARQFRAPSLATLATLATGTAVMYMLNLESKENPHE